MRLHPEMRERYSAYRALGMFVLLVSVTLVWVLEGAPIPAAGVPTPAPHIARPGTQTDAVPIVSPASTSTSYAPDSVEVATQTSPSHPQHEQPEIETYTPPETRTKSLSVEACEKRKAASPFYVDPTGQAIKIERELRENGRTDDAILLRRIACEPLAVWIMGDAGIERTKKKIADVLQHTEETGDIPVFVLYNQPLHGAPGWMSGYAPDAYSAWVETIHETIGSRNAWVILEPDALPTAIGYDEAGRRERLAELGRAVSILAEGERTRVYIDAGHSHWLSVSEAVELLEMANVRSARGFSLNVSNYRATENELAYARAVAAAFPDVHFIIDTSRNGNGPHPDAVWCNAAGRAIGVTPQLTEADPMLDAYLWVKPPGESDGTCNGGPPAGKFWLEYALELIENAPY